VVLVLLAVMLYVLALGPFAAPRPVGARTLPAAGPPQAVLPAAAGSVDIVCALLPPERVAGLPEPALRYTGLRGDDNPYLALPRFSVYEAERVLALQPDLVLAHGWQSAETTTRLRAAGLEVVLLDDPNSWAEVSASIRRVAALVQAEPEAEALLARAATRLDALARRRAARETRGAVAFSDGGAGGWLAGAGTTQDEILRLAGLRNLAAEAGRVGHVEVSWEQLLQLDPDVIVVGGAADSQAQDGTAGLLRQEPALASLRAVAEDRVVVLDSWLFTTLSFHLLDAAEQLADRLDALPAGAR